MEHPLHMVPLLMVVGLQLHMSTQPSSLHIVLLPLQQLLHQHTMLLLHLHISMDLLEGIIALMVLLHSQKPSLKTL